MFPEKNESDATAHDLSLAQVQSLGKVEFLLFEDFVGVSCFGGAILKLRYVLPYVTIT